MNEIDSNEKDLEALQLLYKWTLSPLESVLGCIVRELLGADRQVYAEVC